MHKFALLLALLFVAHQPAHAQLKLPKLISDGMVLQRDAPVRIWGWSNPGDVVNLVFMSTSHRTTTDNTGTWSIRLSDLQAGGPHHLTISTADTSILIRNILIGDVWLASGQSNMELPMRRVRPLVEAEIAASQNEFIRYFDVPQRYDFVTPQQDLPGGMWTSANPETVQNYSAVAYFFAKEVFNTYGVPIGILHSALGGSPAEAWMSEDALRSFPTHFQEAQRFKNPDLIRQIEAADRTRIQAWYELLASRDTMRGVNTTSVMTIPGYWKDTELGAVNGSVWFRKDIIIPAHHAGKTAFLELGRIVDSDSVFVNDVFVGSTGYQYPPRWYNVPEGVLKAGRNSIVIRVVNESGHGGFVLDRTYKLTIDNDSYDLRGDWQYRLGAVMDPLAGQTFIRWKPVGLYNAMISPLLNFRIKGAIWYQGESNAGRPEEYRTLFPALIENWRASFQQSDFPFLFVQLANFMEHQDQPTESGWAMLREAQFKTTSLRNTAMAVTIDIGEWNDIHPLNKQDVGKRLALAARHVAYGESNVLHSGPTYRSMSVDGNRIILSFDHAGSGLMTTNSEAPQEFAVAGDDRRFVWADAKIEADRIIVWSDEVPNPVAVRYAWADNPHRVNLYNKEGLPATPFRSDDW